MNGILHEIVGWFAVLVPILCVWRWRARGILIGALAFWTFGTLYATLSLSMHEAVGLAGKLVFLSGMRGVFYSGFVWLVITAIREGMGFCRLGARSYREHTAGGIVGGRRLLCIWRDLNRREEPK